MKNQMPCVVSFYDPVTGIFTGRHFRGTRKAVVSNTPEGLIAIPGKYDHRSQRVDIETGEVVAYEPPHDPDVARRERRRKARQRIARLEKKQHRRVRELLAESDPQLQALDAEIMQLREDL